jgi:uncharacterized membrane protein
MKTAWITLISAALVGLIGCDTNDHAGGPGATRNTSKPVIGQRPETFSLTAPIMATSIKQGESKKITIGIDRGKNFDQDVKVSFKNVPEGIVIEPATFSIKHSDEDAKVTLKAANEAAVGEFTVQVTGTPASGAASTTELKINVNKK